MDDFTVYGSSFEKCLHNLETVLQRCKDKNLALNWEKCHFMVTEGIVKGPNPSFLFITRGTLPALLRIQKKTNLSFHLNLLK